MSNNTNTVRSESRCALGYGVSWSPTHA